MFVLHGWNRVTELVSNQRRKLLVEVDSLPPKSNTTEFLCRSSGGWNDQPRCDLLIVDRNLDVREVQAFRKMDELESGLADHLGSGIKEHSAAEVGATNGGGRFEIDSEAFKATQRLETDIAETVSLLKGRVGKHFHRRCGKLPGIVEARIHVPQSVG